MEKEVKLTELEEGDQVLWGERKEPLTVTQTVFKDGLQAVTLESNRGKSYTLIANELAEGTIYKPKITPRERAKAPVARNLRKVIEDE